jgi:saccharopine dehydrogenase-like NADP-dependent oxidoreductase
MWSINIQRRPIMKLLALGGSGNMGQTAVRTILEIGGIDQLIVADFNTDRTNRFVESLNDKHVQARTIDVTNKEAIEALMRESDVVMNTVGPYYRLGIPIVQAAIKTGRHYIDINDDYRPTQEILEMDDAARSAGLTILLGMGASPGITNILARHAANQLDEVDYIQTAWGAVGGVLPSRSEALQSDEFTEERIAAATVHFMHIVALKIPLFRDGKFIEVNPLEDGEDMTFPEGKGFFYYIGHAEPVTLPRFIKELKGACNLFGSWFGPEAYDVLRSLGVRIRDGKLSAEQAAGQFARELREAITKQRPDEPQDTGPWLGVGGLHASASGKKGGKRMKYGYGLKIAPPGGMAGETGIPLAIGTDMIIRGQISQRGVMAPEACIEPMPFFERLRQYYPSSPKSINDIIYEVTEEL